MSTIYKTIFFSFILLWGANIGFAQENINCDIVVDEANELYNAGKYDECIQHLESAFIKCKLSKKKKEQAYELIINSNIEKDNLDEMDKGYKNLLAHNPVYNLKDYNGLDEFSNHFKTYYVYPKTAIGVRPYFALPAIVPSKIYTVLPSANYDAKYKTTNYFNSNLFFDYRIKEKISAYIEAGYFTLTYQRELKDNYWKLNYSERMNFFELNIAGKYLFNTTKKLNYYFLAGYGSQLLTESKLSLDQEKIRIDPYDGTSTINKGSFFNFDASKLRNKYIYSVLLGAGFQYRIGYVGVGFDARINYALNYLNDTKARFFESSLIRDFNYIDNNMRTVRIDMAFTACYYLKFKVKKKQNG